MLIFQMFPAVLSLVALYALFDRLGEYIPFIGLNTHGGVIFAYLGGIALHVWTIKGYFETIDSSLEEAAALDGATPWQAFRLVLLPLSVPILAVVFILSFIAAITEVPVASLLLRDVNSYTLAVGMQQYLNPQNYLWGDFAAGCRDVCITDHHRLLAGSTLAGQRPDGRWCERLKMLFCQCYAAAPSTYSTCWGAPRSAFFYSRFSRFELHSHRVITNKQDRCRVDQHIQWRFMIDDDQAHNGGDPNKHKVT